MQFAMRNIKLQVTSGHKSLGSIELDAEQTKWVRTWAEANECDPASLIKRAIYMAVAPDERSDALALDCPPGFCS